MKSGSYYTNKNKNNRRDHRDAMAAILEVLSVDGGHGAGFGVGITNIMYTTKMPWRSLLRFLDMLTEYKMMTSKMMRGTKVKSRQHHRVFFITPKGIHFLKLYKKLAAFLEKGKPE